MPFDTVEVRISLTKLLTAVVLVIVPLSFLGLYLTSRSYSSLEQAVGAHLRDLAQGDSSAVAQFINDRVAEVKVLAAEPAVANAVISANRASTGLSAAVLSDKIEKTEADWNRPAGERLAGDLLSSPASVFLSRYKSLEPRLLRITVSDKNGAVVAASDKPTHYLQTTQPYWQTVFSEGRSNPSVSDVLYSDEAQYEYIVISLPILDDASHQFSGAISALVGFGSPFGLLGFEEKGNSERRLLVRNDGTVIVGPNRNVSAKIKSNEYVAVRDALGAVQGRQAGYVVTNTPDGARIVGFADAGLNQSYPNLTWSVIASYDMSEAMLPVYMVGRFAVSMVGLSLLMLILLGVYFYLHRKQQLAVIAMEEPRHPDRAA
jgi:hypothetical protein